MTSRFIGSIAKLYAINCDYVALKIDNANQMIDCVCEFGNRREVSFSKFENRALLCFCQGCYSKKILEEPSRVALDFIDVAPQSLQISKEDYIDWANSQQKAVFEMLNKNNYKDLVLEKDNSYDKSNIILNRQDEVIKKQPKTTTSREKLKQLICEKYEKMLSSVSDLPQPDKFKFYQIINKYEAKGVKFENIDLLIKYFTIKINARIMGMALMGLVKMTPEEIYAFKFYHAGTVSNDKNPKNLFELSYFLSDVDNPRRGHTFKIAKHGDKQLLEDLKNEIYLQVLCDQYSKLSEFLYDVSNHRKIDVTSPSIKLLYEKGIENDHSALISKYTGDRANGLSVVYNCVVKGIDKNINIVSSQDLDFVLYWRNKVFEEIIKPMYLEKLVSGEVE